MSKFVSVMQTETTIFPLAPSALAKQGSGTNPPFHLDSMGAADGFANQGYAMGSGMCGSATLRGDAHTTTLCAQNRGVKHSRFEFAECIIAVVTNPTSASTSKSFPREWGTICSSDPNGPSAPQIEANEWWLYGWKCVCHGCLCA